MKNQKCQKNKIKSPLLLKWCSPFIRVPARLQLLALLFQI